MNHKELKVKLKELNVDKSKGFKFGAYIGGYACWIWFGFIELIKNILK